MAKHLDTGLSRRDVGITGDAGAVISARLARLGRHILLAAAATALVAILLNIASEGVGSPISLFIIAAACALAATLLLGTKGFPRAAVISVTVILLVLMVSVILARGTVRAPAASIIVLTTAIASLAFSTRGFVVTLACGVTVLGGLAYADARGLLGPASTIPLVSFWFSISAVALFTGVIVRYGRRVVEDALARTHNEMVEHQRARAELARASELLQRTGELAKVGGWELELPSLALYWTPETCRIHEIDPPVTPSLEAAINFYAPEARPVIEAAVKAGMEKGAPWDLELPLITATGRRIWVRAQGAAILEGGKPVKLLGYFQDISERKQAENARASLEAQLRQAQKMQAIGTLAGGIAHDFNNIIAIILGNTEMARRDLGNETEVLNSLNEIHKAGARARDLVQQILSFSRRRPAEKKPIALRPVIEESARLLRATLPPRLTLNVDCADGLPPILGDASLIEQIIVNLATNAMQAMRGGPGRIGIRLDSVTLDAALSASHPALSALPASCKGQCNQLLRLTVSDDGPGMDAATLERIFDPFFTTKPTDEGTGLGLSVVHGITQAHDGAITVSSEPGNGAVFTLYFPATEDAAASTAQRTATADRPEQAPGKQRIAYIDDETALVVVTSRLLERRGFRVKGYSNQQAALDAIRADPLSFDVVVTDYNMPGMSGLDIARELRQIRAGLPVAVASGFVDEVLREQAVEAGVREVILKASAVEDMCDAIARFAQTACA
jgi:signal transduction histidine kinase/ActR/RegA family two-component response regulator